MHGIYVPGLGDNRLRGQDKLSKLWVPKHGIELECHAVGWSKGKHFAPKLDRLLAAIDETYQHHGRVPLVASSAGASAALNAFARRQDKVSSVSILCGKIRNPKTISKAFQKANPAFMESLAMLPDSLAALDAASLDRVQSIRPWQDSTVPPDDTIIEGAHMQRQHSFHHAGSIAIGLSLASGRIARFIRSHAN